MFSTSGEPVARGSSDLDEREDVKVEDDVEHEGSDEEENVDLGDDRITDDEEDIDDDEDRKKFSFGMDPLTGRKYYDINYRSFSLNSLKLGLQSICYFKHHF